VDGAQPRGRTGGPRSRGEYGTSNWDGCRGRGTTFLPPPDSGAAEALRERPARRGCLNASPWFLIPGVDGGLSAAGARGAAVCREGLCPGEGVGAAPRSPSDQTWTRRPHKSSPSQPRVPQVPAGDWWWSHGYLSPPVHHHHRVKARRQVVEEGRAPAPASPPPSWGIKPPADCGGRRRAGAALGGCVGGAALGSPPPLCRGTEPRTPPAHHLHPWQVKPARGNAAPYPAVGSRGGFGVRWVTQPHKRVGFQWGGR